MFKRKTFITVMILAAMSLSACGVLPQTLSGVSNLNPFASQAQENAPAVPDAQDTVEQSQLEEAEETEKVEEPAAAAIEPSEELLALQGTLEQIYVDVNPSVVNIQVTIEYDDEVSQYGFPFDEYYGELPSQGGVGSGFVWDKEGHIVTNNHVVENASQITVTFEDGRILSGEVVGTDPDADLAVIKVDTDAGNLKPVKVADSSSVNVGQLAIAIGNPFALQGTMTVGIVSALNRSLPVDSTSWNGATYTIPEIIQTDAPINPGNSGGVLLNDEGELIGVPTAIESTTKASAGIGFVIPSDIVMRVVPQLIENGEFQHPWLGISGTTMTSLVAEEMGLDESQRGVLVIEVLENSPAEEGGLRGSERQVEINGSQTLIGGDVIVRIGDEKVEQFDDVASYLVRKGEVGEPLTLVVLRDGKEKSIEVTLAERPGDENSLVEVERRGIGSRQESAWLGITGVTLNQKIADALGLDEDQQGVAVMEIVPTGPADEAGLEPLEMDRNDDVISGDVIVSLDNRSIDSMDDLVDVLAGLKAGDEVTLGVIRGSKEVSIDITLGERPMEE